MGKDNCKEHFGVFQKVRTQTQFSLGGILSTGAAVWLEIVIDTSELLASKLIVWLLGL